MSEESEKRKKRKNLRGSWLKGLRDSGNSDNESPTPIITEIPTQAFIAKKGASTIQSVTYQIRKGIEETKKLHKQKCPKKGHERSRSDTNGKTESIRDPNFLPIEIISEEVGDRNCTFQDQIGFSQSSTGRNFDNLCKKASHKFKHVCFENLVQKPYCRNPKASGNQVLYLNEFTEVLPKQREVVHRWGLMNPQTDASSWPPDVKLIQKWGPKKADERVWKLPSLKAGESIILSVTFTLPKGESSFLSVFKLAGLKDKLTFHYQFVTGNSQNLRLESKFAHKKIRAWSLAVKEQQLRQKEHELLQKEEFLLRQEQKMNFEIDFENIEFKEYLGRGNFGYVQKAIWNGLDVAIKTLHTSAFLQQKERLTFENEAQLLKSFRHPNILMFLGVIKKDSKLMLVTEYAANRSLRDFLENNSADLMQSITFAQSIASGMVYLHKEKQILHRDLKTKNILVTASQEIRIADFGLSGTGSGKSQFYFPILAPEVYSQQLETEQMDIFAYALVLFELFTGDQPWPQIMDIAEIRIQILKGNRPLIPNSVPAQISGLIKYCWAQDRFERPSGFSQIHTQIQEIKRALFETPFALKSYSGFGKDSHSANHSERTSLESINNDNNNLIVNSPIAVPPKKNIFSFANFKVPPSAKILPPPPPKQQQTESCSSQNVNHSTQLIISSELFLRETSSSSDHYISEEELGNISEGSSFIKIDTPSGYEAEELLTKD